MRLIEHRNGDVPNMQSNPPERKETAAYSSSICHGLVDSAVVASVGGRTLFDTKLSTAGCEPRLKRFQTHRTQTATDSGSEVGWVLLVGEDGGGGRTRLAACGVGGATANDSLWEVADAGEAAPTWARCEP